VLLLKFVNALILGIWAILLYTYGLSFSPFNILGDLAVGILTFTLATFASELVQERLIEKFNKT
jgi:4-hydroxybenzoate polyprenyltransferase